MKGYCSWFVFCHRFFFCILVSCFDCFVCLCWVLSDKLIWLIFVGQWFFLCVFFLVSKPYISGNGTICFPSLIANGYFSFSPSYSTDVERFSLIFNSILFKTCVFLKLVLFAFHWWRLGFSVIFVSGDLMSLMEFMVCLFILTFCAQCSSSCFVLYFLFSPGNFSMFTSLVSIPLFVFVLCSVCLFSFYMLFVKLPRFPLFK